MEATDKVWWGLRQDALIRIDVMHILDHWTFLGLLVGAAFSLAMAVCSAVGLFRSKRILQDLKDEEVDFTDEWFSLYRFTRLLRILFWLLLVLVFVQTFFLRYDLAWIHP